MHMITMRRKNAPVNIDTATPYDIDGDIMLIFVRSSALDDPHFDPDSISVQRNRIDDQPSSKDTGGKSVSHT